MEQRIITTLSINDLERVIRRVIRDELQGLSETNRESVSVLTQKEVLELLGISLPTLHTWERKGLIKGKRIGRRVFYLEKEILKALEKSKIASKI